MQQYPPQPEQPGQPQSAQPVQPYANQQPQMYAGQPVQSYQVPYPEHPPQDGSSPSLPLQSQQYAYPAQPPQQPPYGMPQQGPYGMPQQAQVPGGQPQMVVQHFYGAPMGQPNVTVNIVNQGPSFLVRVLYFIFIGWWVGFFWLNLGFFLCFTVVLLPVGLVMLNNLPGVMTLRPKNMQTSVSVSGNNVTVNVGGTQQYSFLMRALYFVFIGWWAGYFWALLGYFCCLTGILIPAGLLMLNRLPMVLTLRRN